MFSKALLNAVDQGELARLKEIIGCMKTNGVDINQQWGYGFTALIRACNNGHTEVALELLKVTDGLDVNIQDNDGSTALMLACHKGHADIALALL